MHRQRTHHIAGLLSGAAIIALATSAHAEERAEFRIPPQRLDTALTQFGVQSGHAVMAPTDITKTKTSRGVIESAEPAAALRQLLLGTGLTFTKTGDTFAIVVARNESPSARISAMDAIAPAETVSGSAVEGLVVTAQKRREAIQDVPIAISAFTQDTLNAMKIEGGPDLLKAIPNVTFTKTNFTSYNIQIRGIGTQAISVTTDPAVAVAFNSTSFIRNHLFEQEFFDVERVEVLRGPQGTLYGRNATAGVVNIISAKPTDEWEAEFKSEIGNYDSRRLAGWVNVPIIGDVLDVRVAGAWTARNGYAFNEATDRPIDGRDLWSSRLSVRFHPFEQLTADLVWERFQEDDDRARSTKQLCKKDPGPTSVAGLDITDDNLSRTWLSQGCVPTSLFAPTAYETPNGQTIPFVAAGEFLFNGGIVGGSLPGGFGVRPVDPYASVTQPRDLRVIQSDIDPTYSAESDVVQLDLSIDLSPSLTLTSQTGFSEDNIRSSQDLNRFNTTPDIFASIGPGYVLGQCCEAEDLTRPALAPDGIYCDPQLGCSDKMVGRDLSRARSTQWTQEFRLASNFDGPLNFSAGVNYTNYKTLEDYFVFFNLLTLFTQIGNHSGIGEIDKCYFGAGSARVGTLIEPVPYTLDVASLSSALPSIFGCTNLFGSPGTYIDPNPIGSLDGNGHNYFRSKNPYKLDSKAAFGEIYYRATSDVKFTLGLRWTDDKKRAEVIPSWAYLQGGGYPVISVNHQQWKEWSGRFNVDWSPDISFTDQTMFYASYARGYKGGGANPPGPAINALAPGSLVVHPLTFEPEFVNAFEIGSKNTLFEGMTANAAVFYYDYSNYQVSQIVDRTAINQNFDATIWGFEFESLFALNERLRFNFTLGYQDSAIGEGMQSIDLMNRTQGREGWVLVKPFVTETSNCILPDWVVRELILQSADNQLLIQAPIAAACGRAYNTGPTAPPLDIEGFDPASAPNNGAGFFVDLEDNELPNTPHWTWSLGAQYEFPLPADWTATVRGDFYHQSQSYFRVYNVEPYDKLRGWNNLNLSFSAEQPEFGLRMEVYVKNALDSDAITGAFLNSDDTALTTNVFIIDPRLIGVNITKRF